MAVKRNGIGARLEQFSSWATATTGSTTGFSLAALMILVWLLTGPAFHYSDTWQLVMNTITSIITFLMVFLLQRSQNKESMAVQLKLNELVAAKRGASNRLIDVEDLSEQELKILHEHFQRLTEIAKTEEDLTRSHSIEEAETRYSRKLQPRAKTAVVGANERSE
jgi:low affinity Fe/Cu permease